MLARHREPRRRGLTGRKGCSGGTARSGRAAGALGFRQAAARAPPAGAPEPCRRHAARGQQPEQVSGTAMRWLDFLERCSGITVHIYVLCDLFEMEMILHELKCLSANVHRIIMIHSKN